MQSPRHRPGGGRARLCLKLLVPKHLAMIMDGNGRWAIKRLLPRVAGHARRVRRVRDIVESCIGATSATSPCSPSAPKRPADEVNHLMGMFVSALEAEVRADNRKIVGRRSEDGIQVSTQCPAGASAARLIWLSPGPRSFPGAPTLRPCPPSNPELIL